MTIPNITQRRKAKVSSASEQSIKLPFQKRIAIRNPNRHYVGSSSKGDCHICGRCMGNDNCVPWYESMCERCRQRYIDDLANGWTTTISEEIDPKYQVVLWRFQQCILFDLKDEKISEAEAREELKEVVGIARIEIDKIKRQEVERTARSNEWESESQQIKSLSHRLL